MDDNNHLTQKMYAMDIPVWMVADFSFKGFIDLAESMTDEEIFWAATRAAIQERG